MQHSNQRIADQYQCIYLCVTGHCSICSYTYPNRLYKFTALCLGIYSIQTKEKFYKIFKKIYLKILKLINFFYCPRRI